MYQSTHIGSLPFATVDEAIHFNQYFSLPVLSTLPQLSSNEYMLNQIVGGIKEAVVTNYKICFRKPLHLSPNKFPFIIESRFVDFFSGQKIKWQIVGIVTLLKSFDRLLSSQEKNRIFDWHLDNIVNYHQFLCVYHPDVQLIVDEPMLQTLEEREVLDRFVAKLKQQQINAGVHCCSYLSPVLFNDWNLSLLSLDVSLYSKVEMNYIQKQIPALYLGIVSETTVKVASSIKSEIRKDDALTPTCGLAFCSPRKSWEIAEFLKS